MVAGFLFLISLRVANIWQCKVRLTQLYKQKFSNLHLPSPHLDQAYAKHVFQTLQLKTKQIQELLWMVPQPSSSNAIEMKLIQEPDGMIKGLIRTGLKCRGLNYLAHIEGPDPLDSPPIVYNSRSLPLSLGQDYVYEVLIWRHNSNAFEIVSRHVCLPTLHTNWSGLYLLLPFVLYVAKAIF